MGASAAVMARRLRAAGVAGARGFSVNVAAFETTARAVAYGRAISRRTGGAHFVIDTSRNGAGPAGPATGATPPAAPSASFPTTQTGDPLVDAFLWVKRPGESDGTCNGGPARRHLVVRVRPRARPRAAGPDAPAPSRG